MPGRGRAVGVHVAMSNTLNTPVEALELEFPMRVREYSLRRGSGGAGRPGAATASSARSRRSAEMEYSLLTERVVTPPGAAGGEPGAPGRNLLIGPEGHARVLASKSRGRLRAGSPPADRDPRRRGGCGQARG